MLYEYMSILYFKYWSFPRSDYDFRSPLESPAIRKIFSQERAIREGDLTGVKQALDDGAPPDGDRNAGKKPIHFAVESGLVQITELLCERGADLNVANPEDQGEY